METIIVLAVMMLIGFVYLDVSNKRSINQLKADMLTPEQLDSELKKTKSSIKDSLSSKKQTFYQDASDVTEVFLKTLSNGKSIKVYIEAEYNYILTIADERFGSDSVECETFYESKNRFQIAYYLVYLKK